MRRLLAVAALYAASPVAAAESEAAVLAGGCFWGVEAVFEHVKGVRGVVSGYAGGSAADASYAKVNSNRTGHAEAVRISYDPDVVSYADLLRIFFTVAHDPTQLNRQGPDVGASYRSAIFPQGPEQERAAGAMIAALRKHRPAVTKIESGAFYPAEAKHQDFMKLNPRHPYILAHDVSKVAALKRRFPEFWRS